MQAFLRMLGVTVLATSVAVMMPPLIRPAGAVITIGTDGGSTVSVGVATSTSAPGMPGSSAAPGVSGGSGQACAYQVLPAYEQAGMAPGGPTPGEWYAETCPGQQFGACSCGFVWIADSQPAQDGVPAVDPEVLARQAEQSITLPAPAIETSPAAFSVVNLPTWLWVDPSMWHPFSASASAGGVSVTATALPVSVQWQMGDGGALSCDGPGTPYNTSLPSSEQQTSCSYVYRRSSVGQPAPDGNPNHAAFDVAAAVTWRVAWSVSGGPGGGALPSLTTSSSVPVRVEQVEAVESVAS